MIPRIVGLDPSLTSTGLAGADGTIAIDPGDREGASRICYVRSMILHWAAYPEPADLVAVEGIGYASKGKYAAEGFGLAWALRIAFEDEGIPYVDVPPANLKIFALGKGGGKGTDKRAMGVAAYKRAGLEFGTDDECDAWWLRAMAMHYYGHPIVDVPASHLRGLDKIAWPDPLFLQSSEVRP